MVKYALVAFAGLAAALPLNINLGAYSPALVVGDGEISFGGAANRAAGEGAGAAGGAAGGATKAATAGNVVAAATAQPVASPSAVPVPVPTPDATESAATDPALVEQAQRISGLQGLGKAIAPRIDGIETTEKVSKRDLAGFDRALKYAEAALVKGPKIQLGTGAEGSGVGIIVDNTPQAAGARPGAKKRDVDDVAAPKRRAKVTTMFVRRGIPASLQSPSEETAAARSTPQVAQSVPIQMSKRDSTFDAVNLNVDGDAGVTMTFVESFGDDDDE
ncbi:hypothetical protein VTI74DRAFT_10029 [Chaetomium olivicolor]